MSEALVIVHLSSLDSYADLEHSKTDDYENAYDLAFRMAKAVLEHKGPVFIVDQAWLFVGRESRPRTRFLEEIEMPEEAYEKDLPEKGFYQQRKPRNISWILFDEQDTSWEDFFAILDQQLAKAGVESVVLGGLFGDDRGGGCVSHTYQHLKEFLPARVDLAIVGCVEEFYEPGEELPGGYTR